MGMRIHGGGGSYAPGPQDAQWQQRRQNFDALAQAITGGNLSGASEALAKIAGQIPAGGGINPESFLGKIGAALQSGDMTSARQILAARNNRHQEQVASVGALPPAPVDAVGAAAAADPAASTGVGALGHGHRHHHHGGGGGSPAMDLSQAIQSGDSAKAKSSMQTILDDLQQVAAMGQLATTAANAGAANPAMSSAVAAATTLLQNPDFKALEDAVANGDATSMKSAWSKLISGSATPAGTTSTVAPPVA